ncbi:hypothetical protein Q3G72_027002 [Acer saccharum]|nr:hypothetical protein Q3G72_027002 [Acer saccharum]
MKLSFSSTSEERKGSDVYGYRYSHSRGPPHGHRWPPPNSRSSSEEGCSSFATGLHLEKSTETGSATPSCPEQSTSSDSTEKSGRSFDDQNNPPPPTSKLDLPIAKTEGGDGTSNDTGRAADLLEVEGAAGLRKVERAAVRQRAAVDRVSSKPGNEVGGLGMVVVVVIGRGGQVGFEIDLRLCRLVVFVLDDYGKNGGYDTGCKVECGAIVFESSCIVFGYKNDGGAGNDDSIVTKMKIVEMKVKDGDTCEEMAENRTDGGHSTFEICVLHRLNR